MKKVFIRESSLEDIKNSELLPPFLFKMVKYHKTSLGDNEAFPKVGEYPFDYSILKKRFGIVSFSLKSLARLDSELDGLDEESLLNYLGSLVRKCKEYEKPIKDTLENIAENALNRLFAIPDGTINITTELTDKVSFKHSPRITPESDEGLKYTFKDIADIEFSNKAVEKRRFINSLIQGGSRRMLDTALISEDIIFNDLNKINPELVPLYKKIMIINDYLLFTKEEELDDKNPMQGAYVETHIGADGERSTIEAQGIIFPLLLQELIKGVFEVFSTHGLPSDKKKAMYVIKKADFLLAEPWDMRFGVGLWDEIFGNIHDSNLIPYIFTKLIELPTDEFNSSVREILASTEAGNNILNDLVSAAQYDSDYQEFTNKINKKNIDKSVIADSYFSAAELTGLELDDDNDNIIEEGDGDGIDYIKLIKSATVDNIDFNEGKLTTNGGEQLILTIDGTEIPSEYVDLVVFFMGNELNGKHFKSLNLHISLAEEIQGIGLGTKIYTKMVYEFGSLYSWGETRTNDEHIGKIYQKLNNDPNIEVTTIPNENGKVDYLAVLKGYNIFERKSRNGWLITEGWSQDKKKIIDRTMSVIRKNYFTLNTYKVYELENKIADEYFHGPMSGQYKIRKYEPLIADILTKEFGYPYLDGYYQEKTFLKDVMKYIWNYQIREGKTPTIDIQNDNFNTIFEKYKPLLDELEKRDLDVNRLDKNKSEYEIIPIPDFDTARKYGAYSNPNLRLCYTDYRDTWQRFTNNEEYKVYLCLNKNTWEKWGKGECPSTNEKTPYDEYGLSMIWVFINPNTGEIEYSNTRWNHEMEARIPKAQYGGVGVDKSFNISGLEEAIGMSFEQAFDIKPGEGKNRTKIALENLEKLSNNYDLSFDDLFDRGETISRDENGLISVVLIKLDKKYNFCKFIDGKWELLYPHFWFDRFKRCAEDNFKLIGSNISGIVDCGKKSNIINKDGELVLPNNMWVSSIRPYSEWTTCFGKIKGFVISNDRLHNIYIPGKGLAFDDWVFEFIGGNRYQLTGYMRRDGLIYVFDENGKTTTPLNDIVEDYLRGKKPLPDYLEIDIEKFNNNDISFDTIYSNSYDRYGFLHHDIWFVEYTELSANPNLKIVSIGRKTNVIDNMGNLLFKKPFEDWYTDIEEEKGFLKIYVGEKENIADLNGNLAFDTDNVEEWPTDITRMNDGYIAECNGKYNILTNDLKPIIDGPKSKWFDYVQGGYETEEDTDFSIVELNGKKNIFSWRDMSLIYDQPLNRWFDEAASFKEGELVTIVKRGSYLNFIDIEGDLTFYWNIVSAETYPAHGITIVTGTNGLKNIVDKEIGNLVSDEWFYDVQVDETDTKNYGSTFLCYDSYNDSPGYVYDAKLGKLYSMTEVWTQEEYDTGDENTLSVLERKYQTVVAFGNNLYRVISEGLQNLAYANNGKIKLLLPRWVERVVKPFGDAVFVKFGRGKYNVFNLKTLNYMFDFFLTYGAVEREENYIMVSKDKRRNIIGPECNLWFNTWPSLIEYYYNSKGNVNYEYFRVGYGEENKMKFNLFNIKSKGFVSKEHYDYIELIQNDSFPKEFVEVGRYNPNDTLNFNRGHYEYNILDNDGKPVLSEWVNGITPSDENYLVLWYRNGNEDTRWNLLDMNTLELMSDETFANSGGHFAFKLVKNGKINFISSVLEPKLLLPKWADSMEGNFEPPDNDSAVVVRIDNEPYTLFNYVGDDNPIIQGNMLYRE